MAGFGRGQDGAWQALYFLVLKAGIGPARLLNINICFRWDKLYEVQQSSRQQMENIRNGELGDVIGWPVQTLQTSSLRRATKKVRVARHHIPTPAAPFDTLFYAVSSQEPEWSVFG
jgi:hypothetical protein